MQWYLLSLNAHTPEWKNSLNIRTGLPRNSESSVHFPKKPSEMLSGQYGVSGSTDNSSTPAHPDSPVPYYSMPLRACLPSSKHQDEMCEFFFFSINHHIKVISNKHDFRHFIFKPNHICFYVFRIMFHKREKFCQCKKLLILEVCSDTPRVIFVSIWIVSSTWIFATPGTLYTD